jgi:hypothetical protein
VNEKGTLNAQQDIPNKYAQNCRYTCFNQRARVSLYCNTYALLVDGCFLLIFSAAVLTVYARFAWVTCIEHVTHKRITTNKNLYIRFIKQLLVLIYDLSRFTSVEVDLYVAGYLSLLMFLKSFWLCLVSLGYR